jgi:hypothetical protein
VDILDCMYILGMKYREGKIVYIARISRGIWHRVVALALHVDHDQRMKCILTLSFLSFQSFKSPLAMHQPDKPKSHSPRLAGTTPPFFSAGWTLKKP